MWGTKNNLLTVFVLTHEVFEAQWFEMVWVNYDRRRSSPKFATLQESAG